MRECPARIEQSARHRLNGGLREPNVLCEDRLVSSRPPMEPAHRAPEGYEVPKARRPQGGDFAGTH